MNISSANAPNTSPPSKAIAIFGGTFDPIHYGHIYPAEHAAKWLGLDDVVLLPAHIPPHKAQPSVNSKHRLAMVNAACQQHPLFSVDTRELAKDSPSYTVETLREYRAENLNARLYFFVGMDSLISFTRWFQWQEILTLANLVVTTRPGFDLTDINEETAALLNKYQIQQAQALTKLAGGIAIVPPISHDISSTQIRFHLSKGNCIEGYTPKAVADYIKEYDLYSI